MVKITGKVDLSGMCKCPKNEDPTSNTFCFIVLTQWICGRFHWLSWFWTLVSFLIWFCVSSLVSCVCYLCYRFYFNISCFILRLSPFCVCLALHFLSLFFHIHCDRQSRPDQCHLCFVNPPLRISVPCAPLFLCFVSLLCSLAFIPACFFLFSLCFLKFPCVHLVSGFLH